MSKNVITIGREYGSGGYEIGQRVAKEMGYQFYDKNIIAEIADKNMISAEFIKETDEKPVRKNIFHEIMPFFSTAEGEQAEYIFNLQGEFIVKLAEKGNCVIAGRRADYYLRNNPDALHLFFYADLDFRTARIAEMAQCSEEEAVRKIQEMDKRRKTSYEYTTGRKWGDIHNYDRMICTSSLGIDKCVEEIVNLLK